jgi:hypothetical protein
MLVSGRGKGWGVTRTQMDLFHAPRKSQTPLRTPEPPNPLGDPYVRPDPDLSMGNREPRHGIWRAYGRHAGPTRRQERLAERKVFVLYLGALDG